MTHQPNIREIVETVVRNHPPPCMFQPNVVDRVMACLETALAVNEENLLDAIERLIKENEIYCPHEGIDRREEIEMPAKINLIDVYAYPQMCEQFLFDLLKQRTGV